MFTLYFNNDSIISNDYKYKYITVHISYHIINNNIDKFQIHVVFEYLAVQYYFTIRCMSHALRKIKCSSKGNIWKDTMRQRSEKNSGISQIFALTSIKRAASLRSGLCKTNTPVFVLNAIERFLQYLCLLFF